MSTAGPEALVWLISAKVGPKPSNLQAGEQSSLLDPHFCFLQWLGYVRWKLRMENSAPDNPLKESGSWAHSGFCSRLTAHHL